MGNKKVLKSVCVGSMIMLASSSIALASPQSKPNGPYVELEQNVSLRVQIHQLTQIWIN